MAITSASQMMKAWVFVFALLKKKLKLKLVKKRHGLEHKKQAWFADPWFVMDQIRFLIILFHQKLDV